MNRIAIIGCGWLGLRLAKNLIENNYKVLGTKTTEKGVDILNKLKIKGIIFNFNIYFIYNSRSSINS